MLKFRSFTLALLLALIAIPATAYTVYLKDGTRLIAREKPRIEAGKAIILLQSGTETSLAASEIDFPRSEQANQNNLGTALVLDNGQFTDTPQGVTQRNVRMTDIARGNQTLNRSAEQEAAKAKAAVKPVDPGVDLWNPERNPYRNLDVSGKILGVFRAHGIDAVQVLQGSTGERILLDITTDSEGSIFRGLEAAAVALVEIGESAPDTTINAFEVLMMTSNRGRAGRFTLEEDMAAEIASKQVEPSAFFVQQVQY